ncbi:hypothetical protein QR98_0051200 [Sarcoptes scabiei]|uniref:IFT122 second beta-propeller domain-containing protein n=1 Tax=Sarcoptes scabiei TaxID=52283 RepID=A0A132A6R1_SARSC|nr:hypothetical protein QR98_0051200 [Sarcoptes scabiei]
MRNSLERMIDFDALFIEKFFNDFFLIGGVNKKLELYTNDGISLAPITTQNSWIIYNCRTKFISMRAMILISIQFTCRALILSSKNLIYCQDNRIKSINFFGQLEKEWRTKSSIRFMKTGGGVPQNESILIGLNDGQVLMIFLSKLFPIQLIHLSNPIRAIEISCKRKKLAIVDDHNDCHVYDLQTKKLLFKESDIKSIAWNDQFEDLLCFTSSRLIGIRMHDFPTQTIELLDYNNNKNSNNHPQQHHDNINNNVLFDAKEDDGGDGDHEVRK